MKSFLIITTLALLLLACGVQCPAGSAGGAAQGATALSFGNAPNGQTIAFERTVNAVTLSRGNDPFFFSRTRCAQPAQQRQDHFSPQPFTSEG
jgi:hypothetical protein